MDKLTIFCEDKRHFRPQNNAARERSRVKTLRSAFLDLQRSLPAVPPNTKLSKLDILVLATAYIYHLTQTLEDHNHSEADWKRGATFDQRKNLTTLASSRDYVDSTVMHLTDCCAQHNNLLPASTAFINPAAIALPRRVVRSSKLKSGIRADSNSSKHSTQECSSVNPINIRLNHFPQSKYLPPMEMNTSHQPTPGTRHPLVNGAVGFLHPVKKWPMRSRLYDSILGREAHSETLLSTPTVTSWSCLVHSRLTSSNLGGPK